MRLSQARNVSEEHGDASALIFRELHVLELCYSFLGWKDLRNDPF